MRFHVLRAILHYDVLRHDHGARDGATEGGGRLRKETLWEKKNAMGWRHEKTVK